MVAKLKKNQSSLENDETKKKKKGRNRRIKCAREVKSMNKHRLSQKEKETLRDKLQTDRDGKVKNKKNTLCRISMKSKGQLTQCYAEENPCKYFMIIYVFFFVFLVLMRTNGHNM